MDFAVIRENTEGLYKVAADADLPGVNPGMLNPDGSLNAVRWNVFLILAQHLTPNHMMFESILPREPWQGGGD